MPPGLASYVLGTIRRGKREKLITFLRGDSFISQSYYIQQRMTSKAAARRRDCSSQCVCATPFISKAISGPLGIREMMKINGVVFYEARPFLPAVEGHTLAFSWT